MAVNSYKGFVWKISIKILYVHRHLTITQNDTARTITLRLGCLYTFFFLYEYILWEYEAEISKILRIF